ncbi:MAG: DUF4440 domain-containing protein [Planctomycetes bacterium]|nr:DUF4440 domain-containing protein [Planctomycetota bacterium]
MIAPIVARRGSVRMNPQPDDRPSFFQTSVGRVACVVLGILAFVGIAVYFANRPENANGKEKPQPTGKTPVILLTGFEPFGAGKPLNPSWEAIKELDGQAWKDYKLVCKQLPVIWGAPLEHLSKSITAHEPVAIFSFGQGGPGAFAFESKASNARAKYPDNAEKLPEKLKIVEDGPAQVDATIACAKFASALKEKGYSTRVSTAAGRYLCEETLYTLEHLKSTKKLDATVMFCHVPPLGTKIGNQEVTAEYVRRFVLDVLTVWHEEYQGDKVAREKDRKDITQFIKRYFSTWSNQDIKGYDACFAMEAVIQHIDERGNISTTLRPEFIASQREYHRTAPFKTTEVAESIDIRFEEKLARVVVYWKLTAGPRLDYGYDHFTLVRTSDGWAIVNLVFYGVPAPKQKKAG